MRAFRLDNKRGSGEAVEVCKTYGTDVVSKRVLPGQTLKTFCLSTGSIKVRKLSVKTGRVLTPWETLIKATSKPASKKRKPAKKKAAKKNTAKKKAARKKPAKRKPAKKTPAKKRTAKKATKKKASTKSKKGRGPVTCNLCGKKTTNLMKHWWSAHPDYARKNLAKAKKARGLKSGKGKRKR